MTDLDPAVAALIDIETALEVVEELAGRLHPGLVRDDLLVLAAAWQPYRYGAGEPDKPAAPVPDRRAVLGLTRRIAQVLPDDAAAWAVLDMLEVDGRQDERDAQAERETWTTLREVLDGTTTRQQAVDRLGLPRWERLCAAVDTETLRKLIGDDE